ncbi:hypothetical protein SAMN05421858_4627 [Haladaptatus litoreus]|uniref:Uncharacterized protein n=1 Tax=Haladaptatus litoreus TaxID=553468 RepID=A0A1N7EY78_9EURY|nr:hypothetical protein SAMN05421858_4627 [Haladaptatus litoreus]
MLQWLFRAKTAEELIGHDNHTDYLHLLYPLYPNIYCKHIAIVQTATDNDQPTAFPVEEDS